MTRKHDIIDRLTYVVELLGDLSDEFIFVGGSAVPLLLTDMAAPDVRPTIDVDVIVEVLTRSEYYAIEKRLAKVGFHPDITAGVICRFKNGSLILDVMSTEENVFGLSSKWYKKAVDQPLLYPLLPDCHIKVINAPLFLCTKYDAYKDRGLESKKNLRGDKIPKDEKDLEDIIAVVDGRRELLDELRQTSLDIQSYVSQSTQELLNADLASRLNWFLPTDPAGAAREAVVLERLKAMSELL